MSYRRDNDEQTRPRPKPRLQESCRSKQQQGRDCTSLSIGPWFCLSDHGIVFASVPIDIRALWWKKHGFPIEHFHTILCSYILKTMIFKKNSQIGWHLVLTQDRFDNQCWDFFWYDQ